MVGLRLLLATVIAGFLLSTSECLRFELQSGHTKCIVEDIKSSAMTVGKYSVVNPNEGQPMPNSHKLTVRVRLISPNFSTQKLNLKSFYLFIDIIIGFNCICIYMYR